MRRVKSTASSSSRPQRVPRNRRRMNGKTPHRKRESSFIESNWRLARKRCLRWSESAELFRPQLRQPHGSVSSTCQHGREPARAEAGAHRDTTHNNASSLPHDATKLICPFMGRCRISARDGSRMISETRTPQRELRECLIATLVLSGSLRCWQVPLNELVIQ
jgi:hypothetical protein